MVSLVRKRQERRQYNKTKLLPGVSLLIAIGMVTAIVLFGILISSLVVSSIRESANINRANEAYYAAEGGLEKGLLENQLHGAGYSSTPPTFYYQQNPSNPSATIKTVYTIQGQVPADSAYGSDSDYSGMYGVPTPGTGNVAPDCDPLKAVTTGLVSYDGVDYATADPADHPCNWNKIRVGETVTIPLYYTDSNGQEVNLFNAANAANAQFFLRIRTACEDNEVMCSEADRMKLDDSTAGDASVDYNDAIVNWQIIGQDTNSGQTVTLEPFILIISMFNQPLQFSGSTTIVFESKLNNTFFKHEMLQKTSKGSEKIKSCDGSIINFLTSGGATSCSSGLNWNYNLLHPVLKFTVINTLEDFNHNTIPFLEYQVIAGFPGNVTPANTSQIIRAEGFSGSFKQILEVQQQQQGGLLEFVVQQ